MSIKLNFSKKYWQAVAVLTGYVIGVGMFGLPFLISRAGVLTFFILIAVLGSVQYLLHLIYANLIIVTREYHRLPGYAGIYLGKKGKVVIFLAKMIGNGGALLAYIIITGIFLNQLLGPIFGGSEFIYTTVLFALEAVIIYFGIKTIAKVEFFMTGLLLLVVLLIIIKGWGAVEAANFTMVNWKYFLLPYGAILFAVDGGGSIPIIVKLLRRDKKKIKSAVRTGTFLSVLVIILFTLIIVGISGANTTSDALVGVRNVLDDGVVLFSLIFGVLTMITSFLLVAESIKETLWWDFKLNKRLAWALAVFLPYLLYMLGLKNLIAVISFAGGVAGGFVVIVLILIFTKLRKQPEKLVLFKYKPNTFILYTLISLFVAGIAYEIYYFFIK